MPNIGFVDGIEATRMMFPMCWFDEEKAAKLIKALISYRKERDENRSQSEDKPKFKDRPYEDWAADPADSFRMAGVGHTDHQRLGFYDKEEEELERIRGFQAGQDDYDPLHPFGM